MLRWRGVVRRVSDCLGYGEGVLWGGMEKWDGIARAFPGKKRIPSIEGSSIENRAMSLCFVLLLRRFLWGYVSLHSFPPIQAISSDTLLNSVRGLEGARAWHPRCCRGGCRRRGSR